MLRSRRVFSGKLGSFFFRSSLGDSDDEYLIVKVFLIYSEANLGPNWMKSSGK